MPRPPAPEVKPVSTKGPSGALIGGVVVLVVVLIAGLIWAVTRDGGNLEAAEGTSSALPEGGGLVTGPGVDADVPQVHVYGDFQCPWCGVLENSIGEDLAAKVDAGEVNLTVTLMSFLDGRISGENSVRAANAALCADTSGAFLPYYQTVYANQPQEGAGWTDDQLIAFGEQAGISGGDLDTFASCVAELPHEDYVDAMQERANRDGVTGTPRMFVNGTQISDDEMRGLMEDASTLDAVIDAHS